LWHGGVAGGTSGKVEKWKSGKSESDQSDQVEEVLLAASTNVPIGTSFTSST
jgi:hypothetical protein